MDSFYVVLNAPNQEANLGYSRIGNAQSYGALWNRPTGVTASTASNQARYQNTTEAANIAAIVNVDKSTMARPAPLPEYVATAGLPDTVAEALNPPA